MKKQKGITLIALIITIIVMLILVGVTVAVALNGGLFTTAEGAKSKTQIEAEKEKLLSAAIGALGENGEVDFAVLDTNLPEEFTGSNGTYTSKTGNTYTVDVYGNVEYVSETGEVEEVEKIISADDEEASYWKTDGQGTILYYEPAEGVEVPETLVVPCQIGDEKITKIGDLALCGYRMQRNEDGTIVFDEEYGEPIILDEMDEEENFIPTGPTTKVKNIIISKDIQEIGPGAFSSCTTLTKITLPEGVVTIGGGAFGGCTSLTDINLPEGLITIEGYAFSDCTSLKNITLPDGLITIGEYAFRNCTLKEIIIPSTVDNLGGRAFERSNNENLTIYVRGKTEQPADVDHEDYNSIGWSYSWDDGVNASIVWDK